LTYVIDPNHRDARASISVSVEAGDLPSFSETLLGVFDSADGDNDGGLSFSEVQSVVITLTGGQFAALDTNEDGSLSPTELAAMAQVAGGEGEGEGGCVLSVVKMQDKLADFFLLGLAVVSLAVTGRFVGGYSGSLL